MATKAKTYPTPGQIRDLYVSLKAKYPDANIRFREAMQPWGKWKYEIPTFYVREPLPSGLDQDLRQGLGPEVQVQEHERVFEGIHILPGEQQSIYRLCIPYWKDVPGWDFLEVEAMRHEIDDAYIADDRVSA